MTEQNLPEDDSQIADQPRVTVYSPTEHCVQCNSTFKKLDKEGIAYQVIKVPAEHKILRDELIFKAEQLGVTGGFPCVDVYDPTTEENLVWFGFQPDKIEQIKERTTP